jgi:hypothetical protein
MKHAILVMGLLLAACGQDEPPPPEKPRQGRAETQNIRNTDAVGTGGGAIADKIDTALDQNDEATRKKQEAADQVE